MLTPGVDGEAAARVLGRHGAGGAVAESFRAFTAARRAPNAEHAQRSDHAGAMDLCAAG